MRTLIVVAVAAERDAVLRGCPAAEVVVSGVGPVAAAAATATAVAGHDAVLNLGVAGGFGIDAGVLVGTAAVAADLGVEAEGALAMLPTRVAADAGLLAEARNRLPTATFGELLTVWSVTSTAATAARLRASHPDAVGEAMEGFGVAWAAQQAGVPFLEVRTISNEVGPRDRAAWDLAGALDGLADVAAAVLP